MATTELCESNERVSTATLPPANAPSPIVNEQHLSVPGQWRLSLPL